MLEKLLMLLPPFHVQVVCHVTVLPSTDSSVEHCEPEVALCSPQRLLNRVYEPDVTVAY